MITHVARRGAARALTSNSPRSMEREVSCMSSSTVELDIYRAHTQGRIQDL